MRTSFWSSGLSTPFQNLGKGDTGSGNVALLGKGGSFGHDGIFVLPKWVTVCVAIFVDLGHAQFSLVLWHAGSLFNKRDRAM